MCGRFITFGKLIIGSFFVTFITSHRPIKSLIRDRATAARCNAFDWSLLELKNKVDRLGECNKNKRKHEEGWHVTAYDGGRSDGADSNGFRIESVVSD